MLGVKTETYSTISQAFLIFGPIAQVVEHPADNGEVSRSSRLRPTTFKNSLVGYRLRKLKLFFVCYLSGPIAQLVRALR